MFGIDARFVSPFSRAWDVWGAGTQGDALRYLGAGALPLQSPNGAKHDSPGQRPGWSWYNTHPAPTGRPKRYADTPRFVSPFQGSGHMVVVDPGRCPRLACGRPLALVSRRGSLRENRWIVGMEIRMEMPLAPTGQHTIAQGNALGWCAPTDRAPRGRHNNTGRVARFVSPFPGSGRLGGGDPGRCPGLACGRPLALVSWKGGGR